MAQTLNNYIKVNTKKLTKKEKRFLELANKRLHRTVQSITALEKLFNKSNYSYNDEWVVEIIDLLENSIQEKLCQSSKLGKVRSVFMRKKTEITNISTYAKKYIEIRHIVNKGGM